MFTQISEFDFETGDSTAAGEQFVTDDRQINEQDIFNERQAYVSNSSGRQLGDYRVGDTRKRKKTKKFARAGEIDLDTRQYDDFVESKNPYYEDVHNNTAYREMLREEAKRAREGPEKDKFLRGMQFLVDMRSKSSAKNERQRSEARSTIERKENETFDEYLERVKVETGVKEAETAEATARRDKNNYDWLLSEARNKRDVANQASGKDQTKDDANDSHESADYVFTHVRGSQVEDNWFLDHTKGSGAEKPSEQANELLIRIPKKEIEHMVELSRRLYGKAFDKNEYIEQVKAKILREEGMTGATGGGKPGTEAAVADSELMVDTVSGTSADQDVYHYDKQWEQAADAEKRTSLVPEIDWARTVYGRTKPELCSDLDPYAFLTGTAAETLLNDNKVHVQVECSMRNLRFNVPTYERRFYSVRTWAEEHLSGADVAYSSCTEYSARYKANNSSEMATGAEAVMRTEKRLVFFHDLGNGVFLCNHFAMVPKYDFDAIEKGKGKDHATPAAIAASIEDKEARAAYMAAVRRRAAEQDNADKKEIKEQHKTRNKTHDFLWIGYGYLERLNEFR